jgi:hypothetical protein
MNVPITRFRDLDGPRKASLASDVPVGRRLRETYALAQRLWPVIQPRGVQKFRTLEEAQASLDALRREPTSLQEDSLR